MIEIICSHASDGNMSKKYSQDGYSNRVKFLKEHNIDIDNSICLNIYNKDIIKELHDEKEFIDTDCVITNKKNKFLYLVFADCIPFIVYDSRKEILSFTHLGWSSVHYNLHKKVIKKFLDNGSNNDDLKVILGPSIKKDSYIKENPSQKEEKEWNNYLEDLGNNQYKVDIFNKVIDDIKEMNIDNIDYNYIDTFKDNSYFSHMRSTINKESEGRFLYGVRMR